VLPLSFIHIGARARRRATACAALLVALALAPRASAFDGGAAAIRETDARRAEKVLAKLLLLYDAAGSGDAAAYRRLTSKLYPGLFVTVAEMQASDLSTDLSTAVFLAEEFGRVAGDTAADCGAERPDIYAPLCAGMRGATVRQLLLAKSRLHARWAEAMLRAYENRADADTAHTLAEMRSARENDALIAARVLEILRSLEGAGASSAEPSEALGEAAALLAWMPRGEAFYQLSNARRALADASWWRGRARESKQLVVSAKGFAPDPLKDLRLDAEQVSSAADANLKSAAKHTRLAEQALSQLTPAYARR
jgi:hypothetical protein